jgi:hypothetical protein
MKPDLKLMTPRQTAYRTLRALVCDMLNLDADEVLFSKNTDALICATVDAIIEAATFEGTILPCPFAHDDEAPEAPEAPQAPAEPNVITPPTAPKKCG